MKARLEAATPGPWRYDGSSGVETIPEFDLHRFDIMGETVARVDLTDYDGVLIAHAPSDLAKLHAALDAVEALHEPGPGYYTTDVACQACSNSIGYVIYPCATVQAIRDAVGEDS